MKSFLSSIFLLILITGCVSPYEQRMNAYNYLSGPHKAMAIAVNSYGQHTGGSGWGTGLSIEKARESALRNCRLYNRNDFCLLEREDNYYVLQNSITDFKNQQFKLQEERYLAYIEGKQKICRSYGYTDENSIAICVQKEISDERNRIMAQQAQANAMQYQANAQAQADHRRRMNALSNYGNCLQNESNFSACNNAWQGYTPNKVCNFKNNFSGAIISGDCKKYSITIGNNVYYKM